MNKLGCGDNLKIMRNHIADETVDLVYLGPLLCGHCSAVRAV